MEDVDAEHNLGLKCRSSASAMSRCWNAALGDRVELPPACAIIPRVDVQAEETERPGTFRCERCQRT